MAAVTGTSSTYSVGTGGGNREDLSDTIYDLFADETHFLTNLDKTSSTATLHEWLGDTLAAPGANINIEGDDATFATISNAARYGNYNQIFRKTFIISRTQEKVNKAGRSKESSRQAMKQMRDIKNDVEYAIVRNQAGTAGGAATGRSMASMETWIGEATTSGGATAANVVRATTTSSATTPAIASGTPGVAPTDGTTTGALTSGALNSALNGAWDDGGDTGLIAVGPMVKNAINALTSIATRQVDVSRTAQASITGAADLYVSNFGVHRVLLHRHVRDTDDPGGGVALCIDESLWAMSTIDDFFMEKLAKTGDAEKWQIIYEGTLESRNYIGNAKVVSIA
jgi:hypothetical protein